MGCRRHQCWLVKKRGNLHSCASEAACKEGLINQEGTRFLGKKTRKYKHILSYAHYSTLPRLQTLVIYNVSKYIDEITISKGLTEQL